MVATESLQNIYRMRETHLTVVENKNTKPTLLFLHSFGGSGGTWAEGVEILVGCGFMCLTPDLRGFGDSHTVGDFSFPANVRDVLAICESLAGDEVILVGHSMGGKIALAVASQQPENVVGLVLIAPSPPTPEPMLEEERMRLLVGVGSRKVAEKTLTQIVAAPLSASRQERFLHDSVRVKPAAWREWLEDGTRQDIAPSLGIVTVPSLILVGAEDKTITRELVEREVEPHCRNATVSTVADAAHLIPLEQPHVVAEQITAWWASRGMDQLKLTASNAPAIAPALHLTVVERLNDPRLADVFRIWEEAFPPEEKNPPIFWLQHFAGLYHPEAKAETRHQELVAFHEKDGAGADDTVGMAMLEVAHTLGGDKIGFIRFLAVDQNKRGTQIGSHAFTVIRDRLLNTSGCSLLVWEVEPAHLNSVANRRYLWYRRMGGRRVLGINHSIQLPGQPEIPLWVLVIPTEEMEMQKIYEGICAALETKVPIIGEIALE